VIEFLLLLAPATTSKLARPMCLHSVDLYRGASQQTITDDIRPVWEQQASFRSHAGQVELEKEKGVVSLSANRKASLPSSRWIRHA
jgi:hypothetical protein